MTQTATVHATRLHATDVPKRGDAPAYGYWSWSCPCGATSVRYRRKVEALDAAHRHEIEAR